MSCITTLAWRVCLTGNDSIMVMYCFVRFATKRASMPAYLFTEKSCRFGLFRFLYACRLVWAMRATWTTIDYYVSRMFVLASDVLLWCLSNSQYKLVAVSVIKHHRWESFALSRSHSSLSFSTRDTFNLQAKINIFMSWTPTLTKVKHVIMCVP